jgi:hypothetical protein
LDRSWASRRNLHRDVARFEAGQWRGDGEPAVRLVEENLFYDQVGFLKAIGVM